MNTPATPPMAAPLTIFCNFWVTSALASSISSRTISCARSVTSCSAAEISCGLPLGSLVAKALEDHREYEPAGERDADLALGPLERRHLGGTTGARGRFERRRLVGRRGVAAHSGGSSSKRRIQIIDAVRWTAIEASGPRPARSPDQSRRSEGWWLVKRGVLSRAAVESLADGLHDERLRLVELLGDDAEDPAGQDLLDRPVERQRGELRRDVVTELPGPLRTGHDLGDQLVGLADLGEVRAPERVRGARDLDDDDLHQVGVVAVGLHDEARDVLELAPPRAVLRVGRADHVEQHVPALEEEGVEHLVLGGEVVIDEPVGAARLVGDVRDAARVEALAGEHLHGGVEDLPALVAGGLRPRGDRH